jgi:uncharacterized protein
MTHRAISSAARKERTALDGVFVLPILDQYLVYAPLSDLASLVDAAAVSSIRDGFARGQSTGSPQLDGLADALFQAGPVPMPNQGAFEPSFLGLLPTRDCNLACEYCGFLPKDEAGEVMDLELARAAVAWYLELVKRSGASAAEVHFFGGEPFCAPEVVDFAVHYARLKAAEMGCTIRFEVTTNGVFDENRCRWVADTLDSVILSLDGPQAIQDRNRHRKDGRGSFATVARSAKILSEGSAEFSIRVCVTADMVAELPEIAAWLCKEFRPIYVCFEPVLPTPCSEAAALKPPDPWIFAHSFAQAATILEAHGVEAVYAAADIRAKRVSFCPVGQDVAIVSPDGLISSCYLLKQDWEAEGLDLCLGEFENGLAVLDNQAVEIVRGLNVDNKPFCSDCFCKWHCCGGCHVSHKLPVTRGAYTRLCIQTRILALRNILIALDRRDLVSTLFQNSEALDRVVWQESDVLAGWRRL